MVVCIKNLEARKSVAKKRDAAVSFEDPLVAEAQKSLFQTHGKKVPISTHKQILTFPITASCFVPLNDTRVSFRTPKADAQKNGCQCETAGRSSLLPPCSRHLPSRERIETSRAHTTLIKNPSAPHPRPLLSPVSHRMRHALCSRASQWVLRQRQRRSVPFVKRRRKV